MALRSVYAALQRDVAEVEVFCVGRCGHQLLTAHCPRSMRCGKGGRRRLCSISKMAVGMYSVAHELGTSTTPEKSALHGSGTENQVRLFLGPAELGQVLDGVQAGILVGQRGIEKVLVPLRSTEKPTKVRNSEYRGSTMPGMKIGLVVTP